MNNSLIYDSNEYSKLYRAWYHLNKLKNSDKSLNAEQQERYSQLTNDMNEYKKMKAERLAQARINQQQVNRERALNRYYQIKSDPALYEEYKEKRRSYYHKSKPTDHN